MNPSFDFKLPFQFSNCDECGFLHFPTDGICPECGSRYELTLDPHVEFRQNVTGPAIERLDEALPLGTEVSPLALNAEVKAVFDDLPRIVQVTADEDPRAGDMLMQFVDQYRQIRANANATTVDAAVFPSWPNFIGEIEVIGQMTRNYFDFLAAGSPDEARASIAALEATTGRLAGHSELESTYQSSITPKAAEELAAGWLRSNGFDAVTTNPGADGGVDVVAPGVVAQVKYWNTPVGRPEVQKLNGVASQRGDLAIFFSRSGYTRQAIEFANSAGIALLTMQDDNSVKPANQVGRFVSAPGRVTSQGSTTGSQSSGRAGGCLSVLTFLGAGSLTFAVYSKRRGA